MNKIGIHALVWAGSWGARECEYTVASSKEAGYDLVEFPVFQPAAMDIEAIQRALSANGMTATCSLGLSFDKDINSEDPACVARGEALLHDALLAARDLGSPYLGGVIFSALGPYSDMPTERSRRNSIDAIRRLAEKAAADGHHHRPRVRQPLRVQPAQHDRADGRLHRRGRPAERRRARATRIT